MNPFKFDTSVQSYKRPIIKIAICAGILIILFCIVIFTPSYSTIVDLINAAIGMMCIWIILMASCEMIQVSDNRELLCNVTDRVRKGSKKYTTDEILSLVNENGIIAIRIIEKDKLVEIGSSSDSERGALFEKRYYIGEKEFTTLKEFQTALSPYSANGELPVAFIDGVAPNKSSKQKIANKGESEAIAQHKKDSKFVANVPNIPHLREKTLIIFLAYLFSGLNFLFTELYYTSRIEPVTILCAIATFVAALLTIRDRRKQYRGTQAAIITCSAHLALSLGLSYYYRSFVWMAVYAGEVLFCACLILICNIWNKKKHSEIKRPKIRSKD